MPISIAMPRLSDTMEEGTLIKWLVKVGDKVSAGDHVADVETDKATMELQAFDDGTVARIAVEEGKTTKVGDVILVLATDGESVDAAAAAAGDAPQATKPITASKPDSSTAPDKRPAGGMPADEEAHDEPAHATEGTPDAASAPPASGRVRVSPLARKLAEEHGVDLNAIQGSGPDGRIIKRDIMDAAAGKSSAPAKSGAPAPTPGPASSAKQDPDRRTPGSPGTPAAPAAPLALEDKLVPVSNMRKTIARRLVESKTTMPHFQVTVTVDMDALWDLRQTLNAQLEQAGADFKLSVNDFVVRAAALALVRHPMVNSSWTDGGIQLHGGVHVGVAVALPAEKGGGLVVPTLRDAASKSVRQIADEARALANKARTTGLTAEQMQGGTFTISNLGMLGVDHFTAIINPPQAAILAVGAALQKPVVRSGALTVGREMSCTLSADHRVIDGAMAAEYLVSLRQLLEAPALLLV